MIWLSAGLDYLVPVESWIIGIQRTRLPKLFQYSESNMHWYLNITRKYAEALQNKGILVIVGNNKTLLSLK